MSDFVPLESAEFKGAVQSLLDAKRFARDIENFIDGILPLVADSEMAVRLQKAVESAQETQQLFRDLYSRNARDAFSMRQK